MLAPDMQVELVSVYGGLPMTAAARAAARSKLLNEGQATLEVAYGSLKGKGAAQSRHVSDIDPVRIIADEELEAVWANKLPAKAALDNAVSRGNAVLAAKPALKKSQPF